jgi:hypothetical protein
MHGVFPPLGDPTGENATGPDGTGYAATEMNRFWTVLKAGVQPATIAASPS